MQIKQIFPKQQYLKIVILLSIIGFLLLWFSDVLPPKVSEIVASDYMNKQIDGNEYRLIGSEYSSAHDCYFVYFENLDATKQRNIGIYFRYFPFDVYFDSNYPG